MRKKVIKKKSPLASLIVTQANELVEARYNLTLGEQRLIFTMISRIQPDDCDFKPYAISISELSEFLGIDKNHIYTDCQKITKKLLEKVLEIQEPGRLLQTHWVSSADYVDGTGMVSLTFDPLLKPYLLQLKGNFTSSKLEMLLSFKSQYTMRMYALLKQYQRLQMREVELEQLRHMLGLRNDQYKMYAYFKRDILESTQKELAKKSDLTFEYEEIKYGRKVKAIRFHITVEKTVVIEDKAAVSALSMLPEQEDDITPAIDELLLLLPEQHRNRKTLQVTIQAIAKQEGIDYVRRNILYSNAKADKSYVGFLNNALRKDWGQDWDSEQTSSSAKKVMEIWERHGFASMKEYDEFMYKKQMERYGQQTQKN